MVNLAYHHHRKLYKYVNFIHFKMSYKTYVGTLLVHSDAAPEQIVIVAPYENKIELFKSKNILENVWRTSYEATNWWIRKDR